MEERKTASKRILLGLLGLLFALPYLFLTGVDYRARASLEKARALLTTLGPTALDSSSEEDSLFGITEVEAATVSNGQEAIASAAHSAASQAQSLVEIAETGFLPREEVLFLKAEIALALDSGTRTPIEEVEKLPPGNPAELLAAEHYREGLLHNPFPGRQHLILAHLYGRNGHRSGAEAESKRAVLGAPFHRDLLLRVAEDHFFRWLEERNPSDLDEGIRLLSRINAISPELIPQTLPLIELADSSHETLSAAVPDTFSGHYTFAHYLAEAGRFEDGLNELNQSFQHRDATDAHRMKGFVSFAQRLEKSERLEEALAILDKARDLETQRIFRAERTRCRILSTLGRLEPAQASLLSALRKGRDREAILSETFYALRKADVLDRSVPLWEKVLDTYPFFEQTKYYLALTLLEQGLEDECLRLLQQYVRKQGDVKALETLSKLMMKKQQWRLALQYVERARIYSPENETFAELERTLRRKLGQPAG